MSYEKYSQKTFLSVIAAALIWSLAGSFAVQAQSTPPGQKDTQAESLAKAREAKKKREQNFPEDQKVIQFAKEQTLEEVAKLYPFVKAEAENQKAVETRSQSTLVATAQIAEDKGKRADIFFVSLRGPYYCSDMMGCLISVYSDLHDGIGYRYGIQLLTKNVVRISRANGKVALLHDTDDGEVKFEMQDDGTFVMVEHQEPEHEGPARPSPEEAERIKKSKEDPYHEAETESEKALADALKESSHGDIGNYNANPYLSTDLRNSINKANEIDCRGVDRSQSLCGIDYDPVSCSQDPPRAWTYTTNRQKSPTDVYIDARPIEGYQYMSQLPQYRMTKINGQWKINGIRCGMTNFNMD